MKTRRIGIGCCVRHESFGVLYVTDRFRDSGGAVFCGINGRDGVSYQFYASEAAVISREEFDRAREDPPCARRSGCDE